MMIFFDIDGTLLNPLTGEVDESTINALRQIKEKGILCGVATGRAFNSTKDLGILDIIKWDALVLNNGQKVLDKDYNILFEQAIPPQIVQGVIDKALKNNVALLGQSDDWHMFTPHDEYVKAIHNNLAEPAPDQEEYDMKTPVYTLMVYGEDSSILDEFEMLKPTYVHQYFDVMMKGVDKAIGVKHVLEHYGLSEYVAMGDSLNDFEMAEHATTFIATYDANPKLKEIADYIVESPHDEIEKALEYLNLLDYEV